MTEWLFVNFLTALYRGDDNLMQQVGVFHWDGHIIITVIIIKVICRAQDRPKATIALCQQRNCQLLLST